MRYIRDNTLVNPIPSRGTGTIQWRKLLVWYGYIVGIIGYGFFIAFWKVEPIPEHVRLAAVLAGAICCIPFVHWVAEKYDWFPMFEFICLSYATQYVLPLQTDTNTLTTYRGETRLSWDTTLSALLFVALGVGVKIFFFYLTTRNPLVKRVPRLNLPFDETRIRYYLAGAIVIGGLTRLIVEMGLSVHQFNAVLSVIGFQLHIATIVMAYFVYTRRWTSPWASVILYGTVGMALIIGLLDGMMNDALFPIVVLLLIRCWATKKVPWLWFMVGIILVILLQDIKHQYRYMPTANLNVVERTILWGEIAFEKVEAIISGDKDETESMFEGIEGRTDQLHKFSYIIRMTPSTVPHFQGETYSYFFVAWIPRILWPGKPLVSILDTLDVTYHLKKKGWDTSTGVGTLPEGYINFGVQGIIATMAIQGIIFGLLDYLLNGSESEGGRAVYLMVTVIFLNGIGSITVNHFGALFQRTIALAAILWFFGTKRRKTEV